MTKKEKLKVLSLLKRARKIISSKENWTAGVLARGNNGCTLPPDYQEAAKFCAVGALHRVSNNVNVKSVAENLLSQSTKSKSIVALNDSGSSRAHRNVLNAYDRTIKKLEAEVEGR